MSTLDPAQASTNTFLSLRANASDRSPGTISQTQFRIDRLGADPKGFDITTDTFTAALGAGTLLDSNAAAAPVYLDTGVIVSDALWEDGEEYRIRTIATDKAGNTATNDKTFRFDNSKPTATIVNPASNVFFRTIGTISGTVTDPDPDGVGPPRVRRRLPSASEDFQSHHPTLLGDGAEFLAQEADAASTQTATSISAGFWYYDNAALPTKLATGVKYVIKAWAEDAAGNIQSFFSVSPIFPKLHGRFVFAHCGGGNVRRKEPSSPLVALIP